MIVVISLLLVTIAFVLFKYKVYITRFKDIEGLPGLSTRDIIRFYWQTPSNGLVTLFLALNKNDGPITKIGINPLKPAIMTTYIEFVEKIYKSNNFFYAPFVSEIKPLLRNGLATTKSRDNWRNDKQIVIKALTPGYISAQLTHYNKKYDEFVKFIDKNLREAVDVEPLLYRMYAETIIESLQDPQIKFTAQEVAEHIQNRHKFMDLLSEKMNSPSMFQILYTLSDKYRLSLELAQKVVRRGEEFLKRHKNIPKHQRGKNNLFYAMLDSGMPDDRIVDNINSIIGGGYETVAIPLAFALYELGKRPDIQQKLLEEVLSIIGIRSLNHITLNDLNDMTYLHCVIKESVRLYFPVPFIDRLLTEDMKVKNIAIPKDTQIIFNLPEIMKSEENFTNANVFSPERFLPENFNENAKKAFLAFGFGLKSCPGKNLAYATMKLFLAKVVKEFEIHTIGNDREIQMKAALLLRSVNGIPIVFRKRIYDLNM